MLALSLFIALMLDRVVPSLQNFRRKYPLTLYTGWITKQRIFKAVPPRMVPYALILPVLVLAIMLSGLLHAATFSLFTLGFYVLIAFICLEPWVLNEEVDQSLRELESSQSNSRYWESNLFFQSNRSLFSVIFWMVVAGPIPVVAYRLLDKLNRLHRVPDQDIWNNDISTIIAWFEWLPALISSYVFMICGNFEAGWKSARKLPLIESGLSRLNESRLQEVGKASVQLESAENGLSAAELLRRSRGLLLRSILVWLALAVLLDYWL